MFFSKSTGGFYAREIHGDSIPEDAVDESQWGITHQELMNGQAAGKRIAADSAGCPVLVMPDIDEKGLRITQIEARFTEIDTEGARPAREIALAMLTGKTPNAVSVNKLSALETEATALRIELRELMGKAAA